ncbi:LOW QUALITY PROTEIN: mitochondrial 54S ribosomal protein YmL6 [Purpureocillium lavendulum]|uniref:Large ribosomal subunit protein uL4m n=1 Tax=Purpureocillium lavendulum TaxID=1247861 RepID=A0AB34FN58_9HYPO|nr:LOW QUALITY PROTEIN: mitochondrial 54S ribosomal protein YmL6 [Purpureocillium lavendulum]
MARAGCLAEAMAGLKLSTLPKAIVHGLNCSSSSQSSSVSKSFSRSMATESPTRAASSSSSSSAQSILQSWNPVSTVPVTVHAFPSLEPTGLDHHPVSHLHLPLRRDLLHAAVVYEGSHTRQGTASSKTRHDVHGSHRKVRPQKGTGRARLGTKQSPVLRGGGKTFGPHPRDFGIGLTRKVYDKAWRTALSYRYRRGELLVCDDGMRLDLPRDFELVAGRYLRDGLREAYLQKYMAGVLARLGLGRADGRTLFVTADGSLGGAGRLHEAMEQVPWEGRALDVDDVDVKDLLETGKVVMERRVLREMLDRHQSDLRPAHQLHDPHGDAHLEPDTAVVARKVVARHGPRVLLQPALLVGQLAAQVVVAGDDEGADLEVERVAAARVVGAADEGDGGAGGGGGGGVALARRHGHPQALGVVGPAAGAAGGAVAPLLEGDVGVAAGAVDAVDEAAGEQDVGVGQQARDALAAVEAVGLGGGRDDHVARRRRLEQQLGQRGRRVEVAGGECPRRAGVLRLGEALEDARDDGQLRRRVGPHDLRHLREHVHARVGELLLSLRLLLLLLLLLLLFAQFMSRVGGGGGAMRRSSVAVVLLTKALGCCSGDGAELVLGQERVKPAGSSEGLTRKLKEETPLWMFQKKSDNLVVDAIQLHVLQAPALVDAARDVALAGARQVRGVVHADLDAVGAKLGDEGRQQRGARGVGALAGAAQGVGQDAEGEARVAGEGVAQDVDELALGAADVERREEDAALGIADAVLQGSSVSLWP